MNLGELIRDQMERKGLTFSELGRRAVAAGASKERNFHSLARADTLKDLPKPETLRQIAFAIEVDLERVIDAALQSVGLRVHNSTNGVTRKGWQSGENVIVISGDRRTPDQVRAMRKTAESIVAALQHAYDTPAMAPEQRTR